MRHLHFTQSLEPLNGGGMGLSTVALHRQFLALGVGSRLCSTYGESPQHPVGQTFEFRRIKPSCLYYAPEMRRQAHGLVLGTDVLHGHGFYVGTNYLFGREARRQRKPLVYHAHGILEPFILRRSRWKKRLVHWLFEDANFRHARLWRALTTKEADQIRAAGIRGPIVVVPVGASPQAFAIPYQNSDPIETPRVPRLTKARNRALFVSRLHPKKGLDLLLPAWAELGRLRSDWELVIAGPDEGGHAQAVDGWIRELGLGDCVLRVGTVSPEAKIKLLKSADLFVLPSYSEGFPSAILEAMAVSVPVVATRACNFPELFAHHGGWECESNLASLVEALRLAISSPGEERKQRGAAGRRLLDRDYTWPTIARRLLDACAEHCR